MFDALSLEEGFYHFAELVNSTPKESTVFIIILPN